MARSSLSRMMRVGGLAGLAFASGPSRAAPPPIAVSAADDYGTEGTDPFAFVRNWRRDQALLGDLFGVRSALSQHGITLAIEETSEGLGNVAGGVHHSFDYDGLTQMVLQVNSQRALGYYGGTLNVSALQIHGINLSQRNLLSLQTASGIEADRGTRLWELWYDQKLLPEDRLSIRVGQQSLDQEWMVSTNALLFVNTMFGWPMLPSADLPGGGPAYPLSTPGLRLRYRPSGGLYLMAGVYSSSPFNISNARAQTLGVDPQIENHAGTDFPLFPHGVLAIAEIQSVSPPLGGMVVSGAHQPLARTWRLGAWYDSEQFADQRFGADGRPLADPASSGDLRFHRGNIGLYGVIDQMIWRSAKDPNRTLSAFGRAMGTPFADRNLISYSANLGLVLRDPFPYRTADSLGLGMGFARVSPSTAAADHDVATFGGTFNPRRSSETFVEVTYQRQVTPWLQVQPDAQYVFNPGGGVVDPNNPAPTRRIGNELVLGVRANIAL